MKKITIALFIMTTLFNYSVSAENLNADILFSRAVLNTGNTARIKQVFAKAKRGEAITIGVIGGSITAGAAASKPENRWANLITKWWENKFPQSKIKLVNAGIGATDSLYGAGRVEDDLLKQKPDFIVIEYSVNDVNEKKFAETVEGIIRQTLKSPKKPAVMILFTLNENGDNAQEWHSKVGKYYDIPMISYRDAVWPELEAKKITWQDISPDNIHPNDRGHKICSYLITRYLESVLKNKEVEKKKKIPAPLFTDTFEHAERFRGKNLIPSKNNGWKKNENGWTAEKPGSEIVFDIPGRLISILFYRVKDDMGRVEVTVDGKNPVVLDAYSYGEWGGGHTPAQTIAKDLKPGTHKIRIKILKEKAEKSKKNKFEIREIMAFGVNKKKSPENVQSLTVEVNPWNIACENFIGFGNEWDSRAYDLNKITDEDFKLIRKRIEWMKLPIARIMIIGNMCYKGNGKFDWDSQEMKALYRHLDLCQKLGITVILTDWGCQSEWLKVPEVESPDDKKYAEIIATYTDYLINKKGYDCIKYLVMINEPNLYPVKNQWEKWKGGIKNLSSELKKKNLDEKIILTGSDESCGDDWHYKTVDQLKNFIGAYDVHKYANDEDVEPGKLFNYYYDLWQYALKKDPNAKNKPFIVGEAGLNNFAKHPVGNGKINTVYYGVFMADYAVQAANAGSSAVLGWMLDDNSHQGFYWGLWSDKNNGMKLRPWFFTWSLLSKYFPQGSVIYRIEQPADDIRILAAKFVKGKKTNWSFCIVNRGDKPKNIKLKIPGVDKLNIKEYIFNETNSKTDESGFPLPEKFTVLELKKGIICPGNTVLILTTDVTKEELKELLIQHCKFY